MDSNIEFIKTPVLSSLFENERKRDYIAKHVSLKVAYECPHCLQALVMYKTELLKVHPLKNGYPATKCPMCKQHIFIYVKL